LNNRVVAVFPNGYFSEADFFGKWLRHLALKPSGFWREGDWVITLPENEVPILQEAKRINPARYGNPLPSEDTWKEKIAAQFNLGSHRFFNHASDLYIGCDDRDQALKIKNGGPWKSMAEVFVPNKGSDMQNFPVAVDIPFACLSEFIQAKAK
jgi:hypothetical protein